MIIAVDFDGTLVKHQFPSIGDEVPYAFDWLKKFQQVGAKLILWTMRCDNTEKKDQYYSEVLKNAVDYCRERGIKFWSVNCNPDQNTWTNSQKCYAHIYIDDAAIGCPLIKGEKGERDYVDWNIVGPMVMDRLIDLDK